MAKSNLRKGLAARNGERFRVTACVQRFGSRRGWKGRDEPTILLVDLFDTATSKKLCDHLWFKKGKWSEGLNIGDWVCFDARVDTYVKGYQGDREDTIDAPAVSTDWRLGRPTKVEKLDERRVNEFENQAFDEAFK